MLKLLGGNSAFQNVLANNTYALSEDSVANYTAGNWSCDGGVQTGANIQVFLGEQVTCTINNNDDAPQLKLVKTVTNDNGGSGVPNDWNLTADADSETDTSFWNLGGNSAFQNVLANNTYALSEDSTQKTGKFRVVVGDSRPY